jgi:type VI secretion system protein ImpH
MHAEKWLHQPRLIDRLFAEPYRFDFVQAVRLLEDYLRGAGISRQDMLDNCIRFENRLSLAFPASQIDSMQAGCSSGSAPDLPASADQPAHIRMTPAFMGFLGSCGVLPLHYTESISTYGYERKDDGPRAFFDIFSTRSLGMFYQALIKHRPDRMTDDSGHDSFLAMLLALAGRRAKPTQHDDAIADEAVAFYAAQFKSRAVPACVIPAVLSEYFNIPVQLEQLAGKWEKLPPAHQARLGYANVDLGSGVLLGEAIYRRDTRARLRLGPLDGDEFNTFLPGAEASHALERMLGMFCGTGISFEIKLILAAKDVHCAQLAHGCGAGQTRLGFDAFLPGCVPAVDRDDVTYLLRP